MHRGWRVGGTGQESSLICAFPWDWKWDHVCKNSFVNGGLVLKSCPTLVTPRTEACQGSSVHGILQARILEWVAISFSRESSWPRNQTQVSCIAGRFLTDELLAFVNKNTWMEGIDFSHFQWIHSRKYLCFSFFSTSFHVLFVLLLCFKSKSIAQSTCPHCQDHFRLYWSLQF